MRTFAAFLTSIFLSLTIASQPCFQYGIIFSTQEQVDSFCILYPDCNEMGGDVTIEGDGITNLLGLSCIERIYGTLKVSDCDSLNSLLGLHNLKDIGGSCKFHYSDKLINLQGLNSLNYVVGSFIVDANDNLLDLSGLDSFSSSGSFHISGNSSLLTVNGLDSFNSISGDLLIQNNPSLVDISGFVSLTTSSIDRLYIRKNPNLTSCNAQVICDFLSNPRGEVIIYSNGRGCAHPGQIADKCHVRMDCLPFGNYYFESQGQIDSFAFHYNDCSHLTNYTIIFNSDISNVEGLSGIESISGKLHLLSNSQLTDLSGLRNLKTLNNGWLSIEGNPRLKSLAGLGGIDGETIEMLSIESNDSLSHCAIQSICDFLSLNTTGIISWNATGCENRQQIEENCDDFGLNEFDPSFVAEIFPVPAYDELNISVSGDAEISGITINDQYGRELFKYDGPRDQIDVSGLDPGMYFIQFTSNSSWLVKKFLVVSSTP